ncbi:MAG TPA: ATP-binding protein [Caulobacteraceae bacterium]|nr:ATP-binding protein [Caulobacteraceae bacterium]
MGLLLAVFLIGVWFVAGWCLKGYHQVFPGFWVASGFLAAALYYAPPRARFGLAAGASAVQFAMLLYFGEEPKLALAHTLCDAIESLGACAMIPRALGARGLLRSPGGFLRLQVLAVLAPCLAAGVAFTVMMLLVDQHAPVGAHKSAWAHTLGMGVVLPAMLLAVQPPSPALSRSWRETGLILAGVALIAFLMFRHSGPTAMVICPTLLFAALRLGPRGAALSVLTVALLGLPLVLSGAGPFSLHPEWTYTQRVTLFQATVMSLEFGVILVSFILAHQVRLADLLAQRAALARAARRRALAASRAKTEFLATMSHEVRTPMNSILGFTALLKRDATLSELARSRVEMVSKAGESLLALLNDILDFSKVEAGQVELDLDRISVQDLCAEVIEIVAPTATEKGLTLGFRPQPGCDGFYRADPLRLRQILLNLLNNAVKFTEHGGVELVLGVSNADEGVVTARFEVRDTGIGVDPLVTPKLFTRFSQADSSVSRQYGGTGLGLAICKGLVERMDGRIGVQSALGEGAVFWFEIPLEHGGEADNEERADAVAERRPLDGKVLLVDDHPVNRQLGQALLEMLGCQVDLAASGEAAVEAAGRGGYDAILMDVHMPGMDGLTATRLIRQLPAGRGSTPIIALSADVMPQNIALCLKSGMVDHVPKPVQLDVLYAVLRRWMHARTQQVAETAA